MDKQQQDAAASKEKASPEDSCDPAQGQSKIWVDRVISAGRSILWPQSMTPSIGPTLLRQPIAAGEELLCRFDGVRPYWLRDWQSGFGGYTKVYEYKVDGATRRRYSVAHVVRPRTNSTNACLCFTLMSKLPEHKPWKRAAGEKDPSRGIILDLQEKCDWKMPATVMMHTKR